MSTDQPIEKINLGKPSLRARLEAYYSLIAPDTISNQEEWRSKFLQIYQKYGGSITGERKLASKLAKKYGTAVRLLTVSSDEPKPAPSIRTMEDVSARDEEWYTPRQDQMNSGILDFRSNGSYHAWVRRYQP